MLALLPRTALRKTASHARTTAFLLPSSRLAASRAFRSTPSRPADVELRTSSECRTVDLTDYAAQKLKSGGLRNKIPQVVLKVVREGGGKEALKEMCPQVEGKYVVASVDVYNDPVADSA
ncbi:hypothetical protein JCM8097_003580 [Rhodosporidiobolus ruineniae]